ncbi:MAG: vWA domain-containing protein [Pseudomonadota bacterium]
MTIHARSCLALAAAMAASLASAAADVRRPELVSGTSTVFKQIVPAPGAEILNPANGETAPAPPAPLYVYRTQGEWLEVGRSDSDGAEGWIKADAATPWDTGLIGVFTERGERPRQVFFESEAALDRLLNHPLAPVMASGARMAAEASAQAEPEVEPEPEPEPVAEPADDPLAVSDLVAIEPAALPPFQDAFYFMPVTAFKEARHPFSQSEMLKLEIAAHPPAAPRVSARDGAAIGVVFVIDTTRSMERIFDAMIGSVRNLITDLTNAETNKRFSFGVIGFRDDPDCKDGIDYRTRLYAPLQFGDDAEAAIAALGRMRVMPDGTSTCGFERDADSFAGLRMALTETRWAEPETFDFGGRVVVLVTDSQPKDYAGARWDAPNTPWAVRALAERQHAAIATVHVKPFFGRRSFEGGVDDYKDISRQSEDRDPLYFQIDGETAETYRASAKRPMTALAEALLGDALVRDLERDPLVADMAPAPQEPDAALRLTDLRREAAPRLIRGWSTGLSLEAPRATAIEPRLLVTRRQLATMTEVIEALITISAAAERRGEAAGVFEALRAALTEMSAQEDRVVNLSFETLGGAIDERLMRLPYADRSFVLNVTQADWSDDAGLRVEVRDELDSLLADYRDMLNDPALWSRLRPNVVATLFPTTTDDQVIAMPLDALP